MSNQHVVPRISRINPSFALAAACLGDNGQDSNRLEALSKADGLFAGLTYLDKTKPPTYHWTAARSMENGFWRTDLEAISAEHLFLLEDFVARLAAPTNGLPINSNVPLTAESAWSAILDIRDDFEILWKAFVNHSSILDRPAISNIRELYKDAKGLRDAGIFAFRDTLTGIIPKDLKTVFAVACLCYVLSRFLCRNRQLAELDVFNGIQHWTNAINDQDERQAFETLAENLWPEEMRRRPRIPLGDSLNHGATVPASSSGILSTRPDTELTPADCSTALSSVPCDSNISTQLKARGRTNAYELPPQNDDDRGPPVASLPGATTHHTSETDQIGSQFYDSNALDLPQAEMEADLDRLHGQRDVWIGVDTGQEAASATGFPIPSLQQRDMFITILASLNDLGNLPRFLSGSGLTAKDSPSCVAYLREQSQTKDRILDNYLEPLRLRQDSKSPKLQALISMAEAFVQRGCLQSIAEVRDYLLLVGEKVMEPGAFSNFRDWLPGETEKPRFPCTVCKEKFASEYSRKRHCSTIHSKEGEARRAQRVGNQANRPKRR